MKKTAQFGLNQWEMSDRIQMQDFNRDNAAIEAALAGRLPMTTLHDETLAEEATRLEIDMAGEGWGNHHIVLLTYEPAKSGSFGSLSISQGTDVNGASSGSHYNLFSISGGKKNYLADTNASYGFAMLFFCGKDSGQFVQTLASVAGQIQVGSTTVGYSRQDMPLWIKGKIPAGGRFRAIGLL